MEKQKTNIAQRKTLIVLTILVLSVIAFLLMHYVIGFSINKSLFISGLAGVAMIVFDVLLVGPKKGVE